MFTFSGAIAQSSNSGALMPARNQTVTFVDIDDEPVTFEGGVTSVRTDSQGRFSGLQHASISQIRPVINGAISQDIISAPYDVGLIQAATLQAAADAEAAAVSAGQAWELVEAPAEAAMDAYMGGSAVGLVAEVNKRSRVVKPTGSAAVNTITLQSAVDAAAAAAQPLLIRGAFSIAGQVNIPSNSDISFDQGCRITQTSNLTTIFSVNNASNVVIRNPRFQGKTTDYVNSSSVYGAAGIYIAGTSTDVHVLGGSILGMAGAGVRLAGTVADITIEGVRMTGAGATYILNNTYNYSGGIVTETGTVRWSAIRNEISGFAQGIVTGDNLADIRIANNYIHDIPGQHGLYLETMTRGVIVNNVIRDCALLGMKIQVGVVGAVDATGIVIANNVFENLGAQGILLDNPVGGAPRFRRIIIANNEVYNAVGPGIEARSSIGLQIVNNSVNTITTGAGIRVQSSSLFGITSNRINTCAGIGIEVKDSQDYAVRFNDILNPGTANGATTEFGIGLDGTTTAEGLIEGNIIRDTNGSPNMRYGIACFGYSAGVPVLASHSFRSNYVSGATDYGYRGIATAVRLFEGNDFNGTTGRILNGPTTGGGRGAPRDFFGTAAPTTGTYVQGDTVHNITPTAGGWSGWKCTAGGTPGTWKTFGAISA